MDVVGWMDGWDMPAPKMPDTQTDAQTNKWMGRPEQGRAGNLPAPKKLDTQTDRRANKRQFVYLEAVEEGPGGDGGLADEEDVVVQVRVALCCMVVGMGWLACGWVGGSGGEGVAVALCCLR